MATKKEKEKQSGISELVEKINKKYGYSVIGVASKARSITMDRIPIGIFPIDRATGGGIPKGCIVEFYGPKQSAKSYLALKTIVAGQGLCRACLEPLPCSCGVNQPHSAVYIDAEHTFNDKWAREIGVNLDSMYLMQPEFGEQAVDAAEDFLRSGQIDIVVIDSVAHIVPMEDVEKSTEDVIVGRRALLVNRACRKWVSAINARGIDSISRPLVILINHITSGIGLWHTETKPGGVGQEYASSLDIRMSAGKYHYDDKAGGRTTRANDTESPWWVEVHFSVPRNRTFKPRLGGEFGLWLSDRDGRKSGSTDEVRTVLSSAKAVGLCGQREGEPGYHLGPIKAKTLRELTEIARTDVEKFRIVRKIVLDESIRRIESGEQDDTTGTASDSASLPEESDGKEPE